MPRGTAIWTPVADKKAECMQEYMAIYPECDFVLFGDNGQGDVLCSELLMERAGFRADSSPLRSFSIRASLMHNVRDMSETLSKFLPPSSVEIPREWDAMSILFFKTYIGAAVEGFSLGLLDLGAVVRVSCKVVVELMVLVAWYPETWRGWEGYYEDVIEDMKQVKNLVFRDKGLEDKVDDLLADLEYVKMSQRGLDEGMKSPAPILSPRTLERRKQGRKVKMVEAMRKWRRKVSFKKKKEDQE